VVAAPAVALPHRPHPHLARDQHVVEPQQGWERPAVAWPGGRPSPPAPLVGVVQAPRQQPREAPMPAGRVEVPGHHQRVPLLPGGPVEPGQLLAPAVQVGPERRHRVHDVEAQAPPAQQHGRPDHGGSGHVGHEGLGERQARPQADPERPLAGAHDRLGVGPEHPRPPQPGGVLWAELGEGDDLGGRRPDLLRDRAGVRVVVVQVGREQPQPRRRGGGGRLGRRDAEPGQRPGEVEGQHPGRQRQEEAAVGQQPDGHGHQGRRPQQRGEPGDQQQDGGALVEPGQAGRGGQGQGGDQEPPDRRRGRAARPP
jgi:hypothetical protein